MSYIIPLQRAFRYKRIIYHQFSEQLMTLKNHVLDMYLHLNSRNWDKREELSMHMDNADKIYESIQSISESVTLLSSTFSNIEMSKYKLYAIRKSAVELCQDVGTTSCKALLDLCFPDLSVDDQVKLNFYGQMFVPYGFKTSRMDKTLIAPTHSTYEIPTEEGDLILYGKFKNDPLCLQKDHPYVQNVLNDVQTKTKYLFFPSKFVSDYFDFMTVSDICTFSLDKHVQRIKQFSTQVSRMKSVSLTQLVPMYMSGSLIRKRNLLIQLCLVGEEQEIYAGFLFGVFTDDASVQQDIITGMHWKIQNLLHNKVSISQDDENGDNEENQKPYKERIDAMNVSKHVKNKANEMLQAIEGSRGGDPKPKKYLDGLLKIPFGVYREEPIFTKFETFQEEIKIMAETYGQKSLPDIGIFDMKFETFTHIERFFEHVAKKIKDVSLGDEFSKDDWDAFCAVFDSTKSNWDDHILERREYLQDVRGTLDDAVWGHKDAKNQLERLIGQWLNGKRSGEVLGLEGPPGTGKTSLAKRGLVNCFPDKDGKPRPFAFLPLGGSSNGATIEGHNYTYVGATWGRIVDILMQGGCMDMIIFIDELDKVSRSERGQEIIGILTHLTDPTQNTEFNDRYFDGIPIDLSRILFVFSYNDISLIDPILRDRITNIKTHPLSLADKVEVSKRFIVPEILEKLGYQKEDIVVPDDNIDFLVTNYTYEAGVRRLREKLFLILRELNLKRIWGNEDEIFSLPHTVNKDFIEEMFRDNPKIMPKQISAMPRIGLVNGMFATTLGIGGIMPIEVYKSVSDTRLGLVMTGSQGDVMKQSIQCARTIAWGIMPKSIQKKVQQGWKTDGVFGIHVHCPETSTPKDGPSAGGAITLAILSLLVDLPIKNTVAMTGEIDLRGNICAIGGLYAKLTGAKRAGVTLAIIPQENYKDLELIRKQGKSMEDENFKVVAVERVEEAAEHVICNYDQIKNNMQSSSSVDINEVVSCLDGNGSGKTLATGADSDDGTNNDD